MGLEADCEAVVWNSGVRVDVGEDGEDTRCFCVGAASVVVVDGEARGWSGVLERGGERRVNEREIRHKGGVRTISGLSRPILLVLNALQSSLTSNLFKLIYIERAEELKLTMPLDTPSPTISLTTSHDVTDAPIPWISC